MIIDLELHSVESYQTFLKVKALPRYRIVGRRAIIPDEYAGLLGCVPEEAPKVRTYTPHPQMFDYQRDIAMMAVRKTKFALFITPGWGKSLIFMDFARHAQWCMGKRKNTLIISPLMVVDQTIDEANRFYGDDLKIEQLSARDLQSWLKKGIGVGITNYEAIKDDLDPGKLGCMVIDECFPAGTMVDVGESQKPIEDIVCGDTVKNAFGDDKVIATRRKEVEYAVAITAGTRITCSPNHPFFTRRGWVCAQDIEPGDSILSTRAAMRMVQHNVFAQGHMGSFKILREILLSEMEDESASTPSEGAHCGGEGKARRSEEEILCVGQSRSRKSQRLHTTLNPDGRSRVQDESQCDPEIHWPQTFRAWGQRSWFDDATKDSSGCVGAELDCGICIVAGRTTARLSHELQTRLGKQRSKSLYRGGWLLSQVPGQAAARQEKDGYGDFVRVESLEILERGHPDLERLRAPDGKLYFYDIEAERHPSFSVNGLLVHNSQMLKSHYGKWGTKIIEMAKGLEWKVSSTGTPAPNDRIEYANQAVFLDAFPTTNSFLARFFVNRGETGERWEMKPHALEPFYRSLSDWSIFMDNPATYGWVDNTKSIPPINVHILDVDLTEEQYTLACRVNGSLLATTTGGIGSRGAMGQIAKGNFKGSKIATHKPAFIRSLVDQWMHEESTIIWCQYDREQDEMEAMFPEAVSMRGNTPYSERAVMIDQFKRREKPVLITKSKVAGLGLNLQVCTRMVFNGTNDSYEQYAQCVKRANRVGSTKELHVYIPVTELERPMIENVLRKAKLVDQDARQQEAVFKKVGFDWRSIAC